MPFFFIHPFLKIHMKKEKPVIDQTSLDVCFRILQIQFSHIYNPLSIETFLIRRIQCTFNPSTPNINAVNRSVAIFRSE